MLAHPKNRVQAIKSKFESLQTENEAVLPKKILVHDKQLEINERNIKHNEVPQEKHCTSDEGIPKPNSSYLYGKNEVKRSLSDNKSSLTRQTSDPGKKLHRSHAFRCDRSQKINQSPKRHGSCNGRSESSDFSLKMEPKLSKQRLKQLGSFLEDQMRKENFQPTKAKCSENFIVVGEICSAPITDPRVVDVPEIIPDSIPDSQVPKHILDQYAKVIKNRQHESRQDSMTDSGVSSETENVEEEKCSKIKKLLSQYEKPEMSHNTEPSKPNLELMNDLCASSETMKLERKNPHLILTDTLKKALKQPLPPGPPPKKPPRALNTPVILESPEQNKRDTKKMLEKLEQVLHKRETQTPNKNIYDIAETDQSIKKPKEMHYLCTELLDITNRTLTPINENPKDPFTKCFNSLNCAILTNNSTLSLPYTRFSTHDSFKVCNCSNENIDTNNLSTFLTEKCLKCQSNDRVDGFKCHLSCKCRDEKSEFFVNEHIYDVPFGVQCGVSSGHQYGTLNSWKHSRSMENLPLQSCSEDDQKIYDEPCEVSRPPTPEIPRTEFQKLRQSFEIASHTLQNERDVDRKEKPATLPPKPILNKKVWKSTENVSDDFRKARRNVEKKFATEAKRHKKCEVKMGLSLFKKETQLDMDRENLNRLMTEIYETVTAACNMDDNKPGSFPTDLSDGASEESVKLTRSLTEKRKNYVRRVSSRVAYLDKNVRSPRFRHQTSICSYKSDVLDNNPYSTFRSWKSFRTSQSNLRDKMERHDSTDSKINLTDSSGNILSIKDISDESLDNLSIDEKAGCVGLELPFEPREKGLFNVCLLVGLNYMTGEAYVKSVFPNQVQVPPHIENLIFPETISSGSVGEWATEKSAQCYSLVLTDEKGERAFGYCRRVLPEGATTCLPLCYCLIGKYRAPGFYYKILQEIESHHGNSEVEINQILHQLFETDFPNSGEQISIAYTSNSLSRKSNRNSVSLGDIHKCKTMPDPRRNESTVNVSVTKESLTESPERVGSESSVDAENRHALPEYYDLENNNGPKRVMLSLERLRTRVIKRPLDPRADEDNMSVLLDSFGAGLVIKVFGSLLLERKVIIMGDQLSVISSCMEALQSALYPFVWQQPLISAIPSQIQRDVLTAPLPILAGMLAHHHPSQFEEGMLIDLAHPSKVLFYQGDESTIVPTPSYKTLKTSLQMESKIKEKQDDTRTRNVMISEAFLRFFVDILGDFWRFFSEKDMKDGDLGKDGVVFDKEAFVKSASSKQVQYFLEWFTETAMFNHFIQNMALCHRDLPLPSGYVNAGLLDTPLPSFYDLFHERVKSRSKSEKCTNKIDYKNAVNKKVKLLKTKLRDLVT